MVANTLPTFSHTIQEGDNLPQILLDQGVAKSKAAAGKLAVTVAEQNGIAVYDINQWAQITRRTPQQIYRQMGVRFGDKPPDIKFEDIKPGWRIVSDGQRIRIERETLRDVNKEVGAVPDAKPRVPPRKDDLDAATDAAKTEKLRNVGDEKILYRESLTSPHVELTVESLGRSGSVMRIDTAEHPLHGQSRIYFEVYDYNGDGKADFIVQKDLRYDLNDRGEPPYAFGAEDIEFYRGSARRDFIRNDYFGKRMAFATDRPIPADEMGTTDFNHTATPDNVKLNPVDDPRVRNLFDLADRLLDHDRRGSPSFRSFSAEISRLLETRVTSYPPAWRFQAANPIDEDSRQRLGEALRERGLLADGTWTDVTEFDSQRRLAEELQRRDLPANGTWTDVTESDSQRSLAEELQRRGLPADRTWTDVTNYDLAHRQGR